MENITDLESLYKHLEENALDYKYPHEIGNLFRKLRDLKNEENKPEEAEKAQWEIDFFNFSLEGGKIRPIRTGTNEKGEAYEYPDLSKFDEKQYQYLSSRLDTTTNPLLKARYAHILWSSPKKHTRYAQQAIDAYLELIKIYEEKDKADPKGHYGFDVLQAAKNAYLIARQIGYKMDVVRSELIKLVKQFNFDSSWSFALRANIVQLMLEGKKDFAKEDFTGFQDICWNTSESLTKAGNVHGSIDMLQIGKRIDQKTGKQTYNWDKRIAESYEILMTQAEKADNLACLTFCQHALEHYRTLKDEKKCKELEKKYTEMKSSMKLKQVTGEFDITEQVKRCKKVAHEITEKSPDEIIKILMLLKDLLPKYKDVEKSAEEQSKISVFQHLAPTEIMDQRGHTAQHFSDEDEKKYYEILKQYTWQLKLGKILLINEIFLESMKEGKLSAQTLIDFFRKHSWYGKNIQKRLPGGTTVEFNWLPLIAPAIQDFFVQMENYFLDPKNNYPNLVLSIDSLILKIEGLLRDLCELSGITTFYMTKDNKGRNITREKDISALLYEEEIKKLFDEDDLLFLRFLLVEKAGLNLRHKVAHSLVTIEDYSIENMYLLILALLKLGRYDFGEQETKTGDGEDHNKELDPAKYVWYACYGSNLCKERFMCYIKGGTPKGSKRKLLGCKDKNDPLDEKPVEINYPLYFAKYSGSWRGGVAFIGLNKVEAGATLGRMYLVTKEQFVDIFKQENDYEKEIVVDFDTLEREGSIVLKKEAKNGKQSSLFYGRMVYLDKEEGCPTVSFTDEKDINENNPVRPSEEYLIYLIKGIKERYDLADDKIAEYLIDKPGIRSKYSQESLLEVIRKAVEEPKGRLT